MTDLNEDLDGWLFGDEPSWDEEPPELRDALDADRMLRRYLALVAEQQQVDAVASARIDEIRAWVERRTAVLVDKQDWLMRSLEAWALAQRTEKRKSFDLPSGRISTRNQSARFVVVNKDEFMQWAEKWLPEMIRQPATPAPEPDLKALNSANGKALVALLQADGLEHQQAWVKVTVDKAPRLEEADPSS